MAENNIDLENLDLSTVDPVELFDIQQKATFATDQALGVGAGALTGKKVDNSAIDEYLAKIEKPTGTDVYSKQAAMYRSQGEGAVLRTQKNLNNLFLPTLDLIQKREAAAMARFTLLKSRMPEFDDTTIFGDQTDSPMPIADEIKNISNTTKEDLRQLSRLNPMDERYDEIKKRVEENQKMLVEFDIVNQQLLEIRNSGTDESQWSKGMDATTANMWRDIYTSNGKNIKIKDGKLVWTDEKGTTKYKFDNNWEKRKALGYTFDSSDYNDSDIGTLAAIDNDSIEVIDGKERFIGGGGIPHEKIQESLNNLGFTDDNGNKLEVDDKIGPKTIQAIKKYLAQKDELETNYLNENLSEEDKQKYGVTTGVGETKVIDLSQIRYGPTMIDNKAVNQDILIRGNAQELINSGVGVDDPMYNTLIKQQIFQLNNVGPEGIKSLIFDGLRNDPDSIYNGINTDSFVEQVVRNHYGDDLTESEIAEKIELMRAGDVTQMYNNGKGGQDTLQTQFMEWYKKTIDKKIEDGVMSTRVGQPQQTDPTQTTPGQTDPNQTTPGQTTSTTPTAFNNFTTNDDGELSFKTINTPNRLVVSSDNVLPGFILGGTTHRNTKMTFDNGDVILKSDVGLAGVFSKEGGNINQLIAILQNSYPNAKDKEIVDFINKNIKDSKKVYDESLTKDRNSVGVIKLYRKDQTIGGRKVKDYLLAYGDNDFVLNRLNGEYSKKGFTFVDEDNYYEPEAYFMTDLDMLSVEHKNFPGKKFFIRFDNSSEKTDLKNTQHLMKIMNALISGNLDAAFTHAKQNGVPMNFTETSTLNTDGTYKF
tara:strand:+ start:600 stop:3044 length:2445 start_codon:yes stop_codon:yes gene_type:complete